jgi:hypothetical protein
VASNKSIYKMWKLQLKKDIWCVLINDKTATEEQT